MTTKELYLASIKAATEALGKPKPISHAQEVRDRKLAIEIQSRNREFRKEHENGTV